MTERHKIIFDMDGTLYRFDKAGRQTFTSSRFYSDLKKNFYSFLTERLGFSSEEAMGEYERIKEKYEGEVSLGFETEHGIDRYDFFNNTWNLDPKEYIEKDKELSEILEDLRGHVALLTAAPKVWATNVLAYLDIDRVFDGRLYTGEPDERKPNPAIFQKIANDFRVTPSKVISIGDQEHSDIIPAKSIGMKTVLIGSFANTSADYQVADVKLAINLLQQSGLI